MRNGLRDIAELTIPNERALPMADDTPRVNASFGDA